MLTRLIRFLMFVGMLSQAMAAMAWNAAGHKTIASLAWQGLSPVEQQHLAAIIRRHPRFDRDFDAPLKAELGNQPHQNEADEWLFCQAAIWPDIARGLPEVEKATYHRPRWHYINLPVFLSDDDAQHFASGVSANVEMDPASAASEEEMNGVQAAHFHFNLLNDSHVSERDKAVSLCWLTHVLGDLHQPMHAASLFSPRMFPEGDKGGNAVSLSIGRGRAKNLHAHWDGLLGRDSGFNSIRGKGQSLLADHPQSSLPMPTDFPAAAWTQESLALAMEHAYGPLVSTLADAEEQGALRGGIRVSADYFEQAGSVAGKQAVLAGIRLAFVLKKVVPQRPTRGQGTLEVAGLPFPAAIATEAQRGSAKLALEEFSEESVRPVDGIASNSSDASSPTTVSENMQKRLRALESELHSIQEELQSAPASSGAGLNGRGNTRGVLRESFISGVGLDTGEQCACGMEH